MKNLIIVTNLLAAIVAAVAMMFVMGASQASTYSFHKITNNNDVDLTGQLSVDINAVGTTGIEFTFFNNVGKDSSLTDVYFDLGIADGEPLSSSTVFSSIAITDDSDTLAVTTDVNFNEGAKTAVLPGGNGNPINFTSNYDAGAKNVKKGLDQGGEWVTFLATLGSGSYDSFIAGLFDGTYRIGAKIQSIADACAVGVDDCAEDSSTYMVNPIPVPAAAWLFGTALLGFFATARRKK